MPGTLYICATPIGNLEDITLRALRVLGEVDRIVGEDTRRTRRLLSYHGIHTPFAPSLYEGVEQERVEKVVRLLEEGENIALVSDAGTPLVSDPGYLLVSGCVERGIPVASIPGPSAPLAALVASGLPTNRFLFLGALPRKAGRCRKALEQLRGLDCTAVALVSPHRLEETLELLVDMYPLRPLVLAREITKVHEEYLRGTCQEVLEAFRTRQGVRGEVVLVLGADGPTAPAADPGEVKVLYQALLEQGLPPHDALRRAAHATGLSRREAYDIVHRSDPSTE
ncbi:MAG: 16S rRNA (cytidine(1402)-2'-O)-methyltransferase [Candidatus Bipolaricaulota bacterium]